MFLGVTPVVTNWSAAADEFSLILDNNPLADFVEVPDGLEGLLYSNILCGVLRGALEMVSVLDKKQTNLTHEYIVRSTNQNLVII